MIDPTVAELAAKLAALRYKADHAPTEGERSAVRVELALIVREARRVVAEYLPRRSYVAE